MSFQPQADLFDNTVTRLLMVLALQCTNSELVSAYNVDRALRTKRMQEPEINSGRDCIISSGVRVSSKVSPSTSQLCYVSSHHYYVLL